MDKAWEKLLGPEAAIEAEIKIVKIALQVLFANAVVSPQKEGFHIGDQGMNPM